MLQTAKALKGELQFNLPQYKARNASLEKQASMLEARLQKEPPTVEAADALDVAKTQVCYFKRKHSSPLLCVCVRQ